MFYRWGPPLSLVDWIRRIRPSLLSKARSDFEPLNRLLKPTRFLKLALLGSSSRLGSIWLPLVEAVLSFVWVLLKKKRPLFMSVVLLAGSFCRLFTTGQ
jgi:hypothetical protein